jgi:hypothetical protein
MERPKHVEILMARKLDCRFGIDQDTVSVNRGFAWDDEGTVDGFLIEIKYGGLAGPSAARPVRGESTSPLFKVAEEE